MLGTKRVSSATAFLGPAVMSNDGRGINGYKLRLLTQATVTKIDLVRQGDQLAARSVWFMYGGKLVQASARRAVIVARVSIVVNYSSSSVIGSPQLLSSPNINLQPILPNTNVGQNLQNTLPFHHSAFGSQPSWCSTRSSLLVHDWECLSTRRGRRCQ